MAVALVYLRKNDGTETSYETDSTQNFPSVESLSWSRDGYTFVNWNDASDGTGNSYEVGSAISVGVQIGKENFYAVWEENPIVYKTTSTELTSIANAIRTKGGTYASLEYPDGFVTAIEDISSGGVEMSSVAIEYSDSNYLYYTDENMEAQSTTTTSISNVLMPVGALVVTIRTGMAEPAPWAMSWSGIELIESYTIGTKGLVRIFKVIVPSA